MRDTDADWRLWGEADPYFGVLAHDRYRRANLTDDALSEFWASGVKDAAEFAGVLERFFGDFPKASALDFGCGVGRLSRGMARLCDQVTGLDVSPGMLAEAAVGAPANTTFVHALDEGQTFDWINSIIVFQHIPPERGYEILDGLLQRVNFGGAISLHFTVAGPEGSADGPVGAMMMFAYDLSRIARMLAARDIRLTLMQHTDHGGYEGVIVYGRRRRLTAA
ncbi:class I SAM-dependent methyltransferase [Brevundimonas staleyi]|uniref:Class I SAM-dependent methyltransferase n=1 Tax=Brevundimonas staleyi TaxID=74326 RepID=A0ABW0FQM2_9CAUL